MNPTIVIAIASVICALLIAVFGAVWRLGSGVGELRILTTNASNSLGMVREQFRAYEERLEAIDQEIKLLNAQWSTAHRLTETVSSLGRRVACIESICAERRGESLRVDGREISVRHRIEEAEVDDGDAIVQALDDRSKEV